MRKKSVKESSKHIHIQEVGDELMIHDPQTGDVHMLNHTAKLVWKLTDQGLNEEDIMHQLKTRFPNSPDNLTEYVRPVMKLYRELDVEAA